VFHDLLKQSWGLLPTWGDVCSIAATTGRYFGLNRFRSHIVKG
jgi:hypothetical protein